MIAGVERVAALAFGVSGVAVVVWVGMGPGSIPWWSVISATVSLAASAGLLLWLAGDRTTLGPRLSAWGWGTAAALVLGVGTALDFALWFTDSRWWTVACHAVAVVLVVWAGRRDGWVGGLRAALVAHLGAAVAILVVFRLNLGSPEQTAVFQAAGVLDAYQSAGGADFLAWVTDAFLGAVLPRTIAALVVGAGLGAGMGWCWSRLRRG